jgi:hypothetical protein
MVAAQVKFNRQTSQDGQIIGKFFFGAHVADNDFGTALAEEPRQGLSLPGGSDYNNFFIRESIHAIT